MSRWLPLLCLLLLPVLAQAQEAESTESAASEAEASADGEAPVEGEAPAEEQVSFPVALGSLAPPPLAEGLLEPGYGPVEVILLIAIDEEGDVINAEVGTSSGIPEVDKAAVDSAIFLRFFPAQRADGTAVGVTIEYPFVFLRPEPPGALGTEFSRE